MAKLQIHSGFVSEEVKMGRGRLLTQKVLLWRKANSSISSASKVTSRSTNLFGLSSLSFRKKAGLGAGFILALATPLTAIALNQDQDTSSANTTPAFSTNIVKDETNAPDVPSNIAESEAKSPQQPQSSVTISGASDNLFTSSTNVTVNGQTVSIPPNTSTHQVISTPNGQTVTVDAHNSSSSNQSGSYTNVQVMSNTTSVTNNIGSSYSSP